MNENMGFLQKAFKTLFAQLGQKIEIGQELGGSYVYIRLNKISDPGHQHPRTLDHTDGWDIKS